MDEDAPPDVSVTIVAVPDTSRRIPTPSSTLQEEEELVMFVDVEVGRPSPFSPSMSEESSLSSCLRSSVGVVILASRWSSPNICGTSISSRLADADVADLLIILKLNEVIEHTDRCRWRCKRSMERK